MVEKKAGTNDSAKTAAKDHKLAHSVQPKDADQNLADITSAYIKKKEMYDKYHNALAQRIDGARKNIERIEAAIAKTELEMSQLSAPSVKEDLIDPLVEVLVSVLPDCAGIEVMGPIGIQGTWTITFAPNGATYADKLAGKKCRSITLITKMGNVGIGVRDYTNDTKEYAPGSIGYASGMNHPVVPVPENAAVKWLLDWVK